MKTYPAVGWVRASNISSEGLLVDLNDLRKENAQLKTALAGFESESVHGDMNLASLDELYLINLAWNETCLPVITHTHYM